MPKYSRSDSDFDPSFSLDAAEPVPTTGDAEDIFSPFSQPDVMTTDENSGDFRNRRYNLKLLVIQSLRIGDQENS